MLCACWVLDVQAVVEGMRANNPGRPIPPDKVLGLASAEEVRAFWSAGWLVGCWRLAPLPAAPSSQTQLSAACAGAAEWSF